MIRFKDILIELLIAITLFTAAILLSLNGYPYLIIPVFIAAVIAKVKLKRSKKILPYVRDDFKKLGYELLGERPLKFSENKFTVTIEPTINEVPLSRYKYMRRFTRIFRARNKQGQEVSLNAIVIKKWDGTHHIEIVNL